MYNFASQTGTARAMLGRPRRDQTMPFGDLRRHGVFAYRPQGCR
jgi:hypothetical protein